MAVSGCGQLRDECQQLHESALLVGVFREPDAQIRSGIRVLITRPDEFTPYTGKATEQEVYSYQRKVGSILYATIVTRPDGMRSATRIS
jgi:hypothetical protein